MKEKREKRKEKREKRKEKREKRKEKRKNPDSADRTFKSDIPKVIKVLFLKWI